MFWALLCLSSGARNYDVDYHIGRLILGLLYVGDKVRLGWCSVRALESCFSLKTGHYSSLTAPNLQHTANQDMYNFSLRPGHYSSLPAPNFQHTANQERNDHCGNQHYSHELLMMGIVVPETCWAYKKYNNIISGI